MSTLPSCKFWEKCYRKNPDHLKQYQHPSRQSTTDDKDDDGEVETKQTDSQKVTDCKPSEEDDGTTRGENRKELTSEDQTKRKRRASYDSGEEGRGGDDDKQNVSNRQKKMKLLNRAEASANEKTIENSRTDKIGEREKHLRQDSGEKGIPEEDDAEKDDDDVDEDDDFLAIVYTGKKDVKIDDYTSTSSVTDQKPLSSLPLGELLQKMYSMEFPTDISDFWNFCCSKSPLNPLKALAEGGLLLVGPFDILALKRKDDKIPSDADVHLHWRFFFDPPELTTVFAVTSSDAADSAELEGLHYGHFRDDPREMPTFVVSSSKSQEHLLTRVGGNLFAAAIFHLNYMIRLIGSKKRKQRMKELAADLTAAAKTKGYSTQGKTDMEKQREKKKVAKPFHGVGMVVPFDKETQVGYRELPETNATLKRLFSSWCDLPSGASPDEDEQHFGPIQRILTTIQFANDECDPGQGLEMGLDLFSFGHEKLKDVVLSVLPLAYKLLDRHLFADMAENHMQNRTDSLVPKLF